VTFDEGQALVLRWVTQWLSRVKRHTSQSFALMILHLTEEASAPARDSLQSILRVEDTVVAIGPRTLAILAADLRHVSDPRRMFSRIQSCLPGTTLRAGVAHSASRVESAQHMLALAEGAAQSTAGEACLYADPELHRESAERLEMEESVREALAQGQIQPYYQPIVELASGQITGFEALARWQHPTRGWLLPNHFLGVARDCGLLTELDASILDQSLGQLSRWTRALERPIRLSVNLCAEHFLRPDGLARLRPILDAHRSVVAHLRVDVSEQVLFEPTGLDTLHQLRDLKVGFHLDDFGVGPESFHCLGSFPFHSLKIDRSLIAEMEEEVNAELIAALLRIARRMKMRTIAEGLVTHAQLEELRGLGCNEAQGFLFSAAINAEEAMALLQEEHCW
jgi:EAL domain-containing protein (putative c-di-GMP-specific phosphodiesterase class I)